MTTVPHTEVRPMASFDVAALDQLQAEARAALTDARGGAAWLADHAPTVWAADDATRWVGVGCLDGHVVGFLHMYRRDTLAIVHQVWVTPQARELGLGDDLLDAARHWARSVGCTAIEGSALPGDRDTKNLYERAGIVARLIVLRANL